MKKRIFLNPVHQGKPDYSKDRGYWLQGNVEAGKKKIASQIYILKTQFKLLAFTQTIEFALIKGQFLLYVSEIFTGRIIVAVEN
jgi:hypothetical protein